MSITQPHHKITDSQKAKELVLNVFPTCYLNVALTREKTKVFVIEKVLYDPLDKDGDHVEQLGASAFSEANAWLYACDNLIERSLISWPVDGLV